MLLNDLVTTLVFSVFSRRTLIIGKWKHTRNCYLHIVNLAFGLVRRSLRLMYGHKNDVMSRRKSKKQFLRPRMAQSDNERRKSNHRVLKTSVMLLAFGSQPTSLFFPSFDVILALSECICTDKCNLFLNDAWLRTFEYTLFTLDIKQTKKETFVLNKWAGLSLEVRNHVSLHNLYATRFIWDDLTNYKHLKEDRRSYLIKDGSKSYEGWKKFPQWAMMRFVRKIALQTPF